MRQCVDIIIESAPGKILLIERGSLPRGWAMPGGYIDDGETPIDAAVRETEEETGLAVKITNLFRLYSFVDAAGKVTCATFVFSASMSGGTPRAASDAVSVSEFALSALPLLIPAHERILFDYDCALSGRASSSAVLPCCPYFVAAAAA